MAELQEEQEDPVRLLVAFLGETGLGDWDKATIRKAAGALPDCTVYLDYVD
jgi:hypothetical protein